MFLHVMRGAFTQTLYRYGEMYAHNPAEKAIFARCLQDNARHLTYGLAHIKYSYSQQPGKERVFQRVLDIAEAQMVRDLKDPVLPESLGVIMGHGVEGVRTGMKRVGSLLGDFVRTYLAERKVCRVGALRQAGRRVSCLPGHVGPGQTAKSSSFLFPNLYNHAVYVREDDVRNPIN